MPIMTDRNKVFRIEFYSGLVWYGTTRGDIDDAAKAIVAERGFYSSYRVTLVDICRREADARLLVNALVIAALTPSAPTRARRSVVTVTEALRYNSR